MASKVGSSYVLRHWARFQLKRCRLYRLLCAQILNNESDQTHLCRTVCCLWRSIEQLPLCTHKSIHIWMQSYDWQNIVYTTLLSRVWHVPPYPSTNEKRVRMTNANFQLNRIPNRCVIGIRPKCNIGFGCSTCSAMYPKKRLQMFVVYYSLKVCHIKFLHYMLDKIVEFCINACNSDTQTHVNSPAFCVTFARPYISQI